MEYIIECIKYLWYFIQYFIQNIYMIKKIIYYFKDSWKFDYYLISLLYYSLLYYIIYDFLIKEKSNC